MRLRLINFAIIVYYCLTALLGRRAKIAEDEDLNQRGKIIVCLTTKPERISKTWLVAESILRQRKKPDGLILYVARDEFEKESALPRSILSLRKRGLKIVFVEDNLRPHNKYFHAMGTYPEADILTIDDDKIYTPNLVGNLTECSKKYPGSICAVLVRKIMVKDRLVNSYLNWMISRKNADPSHALLSLGVGGVLFPSGSLHSDLFDVDRLRDKALLTDDLWIKIMALKQGTKVASAAGMFDYPFVSIVGLGKEQLMNLNVLKGQNDVVFKDLLESYQIDIGQLAEG